MRSIAPPVRRTDPMAGRGAAPLARLDAELVRRGLARSRGEAADLVAAGLVRLSGQTATKPATRVAANTPVTVVESSDHPLRFTWRAQAAGRARYSSSTAGP